MEKTVKFDYFIDKSREKEYIYIPFDVPENVERLDIDYQYEGNDKDSRVTGYEKNVIDLALLDENGDDAGTRGSEVSGITVSPVFSTNGYKRKPVNPGRWQIILGAYQVKSRGVNVSFKITYHYKYYRWLKGDTHTHSTHSDGRYTRFGLAEKAKKKGLDYLIYTDHNNNTEGSCLPDVEGLTLIRGLEWTSYKGHFNMWGPAKPYSGSFAIKEREDFLKHNQEALSNGAVQSVCHPCCTFCPWLMGFEDIHFDCLEVWNGPMRKDNLKAVELWNGFLKQGKRVTAVGGSDYHKDYYITDLFARPVTRVYADSASEQAVLDALKNGRAVITADHKSTMPEIKSVNALIGDTADFYEGRKVTVTADGLKKGHSVALIDNQGEMFTYTAKRKGNYSFDVPVRGKGFVRAEIRYKKKGFALLIHKIGLFFFNKKEAKEPVPPFIYALTNPIYFE